MSVNPRAALDQQAALMQQKVHARQFAATMALELIKAPNYSVVAFKNDPDKPGSDSVPEISGGKVDHITLIAMAQDIEAYIMGDLEEEAKKALETAAVQLNSPRIVRP